MDNKKILKSDYLDILFDGRNKAYGGYELRRNYPKRVLRSLLLLTGICVATGAYALMADRSKAVERIMIVVTPTNLDPPPVRTTEPPPPAPPKPPAPPSPTVKLTPPVITKDNDVNEDEKPPTVAEMKGKISGIRTQDGDSAGIDPALQDHVTSSGTGTVEATKPPVIPGYVEQMPEPSVNVNEFLQKNLRYPELAKENDIQGRVSVRFVVDEQGDISDVSVIKGIGGGCDEEAKRVVMKMPRWKAGRQNGKAVKVYYTLPISFRLE